MTAKMQFTMGAQTDFPVRNFFRQSKMFWFLSTSFSEQRWQQQGITQKGCDYLTGPPAGMGEVVKTHGQLRACGRHSFIPVSSGMSSSACTTSSALQQDWTGLKLQHSDRRQI